MKKLFLLAATCCLVMNSWSASQWTQISEITCTKYLKNFSFDPKTNVLSFNDTYLNSTSMYQRLYVCHFYYRNSNTNLYTRTSAQTEYCYGYLDGNNMVETTIKQPGTSNIVSHDEIMSSSQGGVVSINLNDNGLYRLIVEKCHYTDVLVAVSAAYKLEQADNLHYYSCDAANTNTYFLSNIFSFSFPPLYSVSVTGPCKYKVNNQGGWNYTSNFSNGKGIYYFDTLTHVINAYDTLYFSNWADGECLENISGKTDKKDGYIFLTGFNKSEVLTANVKQHTIQFYVNNKPYESITVGCDLTPKRCNLKQLTDPQGLIAWYERGTGNEYLTHQIWNKVFTDDAIFDALIDEIPEGALAQKFNIGKGQPVYFSKGNLQYQASTDTWRFAENQYDYIGNAAGNNTAPANRATQADWIDLFGFGTSGYNGLMPYETDYSKFIKTDITGTENDWGVHNAISNGGNKKGQWRLLTVNEWQTLLANANAYVVTVAGKGYMGVLVPKTFQTPAGVTALADGATLSIADFDAYNAAGVPFFPMAGTSLYFSNVFDFYFLGTCGSYFTSSLYIMVFQFYEDAFYHQIYSGNNTQLYPVRLVRDYTVPTPPSDIEEVTGDRQPQGAPRWTTADYPRWQDLQCPRGDCRIERFAN